MLAMTTFEGSSLAGIQNEAFPSWKIALVSNRRVATAAGTGLLVTKTLLRITHHRNLARSFKHIQSINGELHPPLPLSTPVEETY